MHSFFAGMTTMGFLVISLLFIRYWRQGRDSIFGWFAIAFALFAVDQALPAFFLTAREEDSWIFVLRLLAFTVIIFAIVRKNREPAIKR